MKGTSLASLERPTPRHRPHTPENQGRRVRLKPPRGVTLRTSNSSARKMPNSKRSNNNYNSFGKFSSKRQ